MWTDTKGIHEDDVIRWLVNETRKAISVRKDIMPPKTYNADEPYVLFVKPPPLPLFLKRTKRYIPARRKFNKKLDRIVRGHKHMGTIKNEAFPPAEAGNYFLRNGTLNSVGADRYWKYLDAEFKAVGNEKTALG